MTIPAGMVVISDCWHVFPQTGTVGVLSSEEKGTRLAGWVARGSRWGPAEGPQSLDGWHAAQESGGAGGPRSLDGWHAALEQGARGFDACAGHI